MVSKDLLPKGLLVSGGHVTGRNGLTLRKRHQASLDAPSPTIRSDYVVEALSDILER